MKENPFISSATDLAIQKFEYSDLKLSKTNLKTGEPLTVEADVRNLSLRDADEVVQLYLSFPRGPFSTAPIRALRGFSRVHLGPGETKHVQFTLDARGLSEVNKKGDRVVSTGTSTSALAADSPDRWPPRVETQFKIKGVTPPSPPLPE